MKIACRKVKYVDNTNNNTVTLFNERLLPITTENFTKTLNARMTWQTIEIVLCKKSFVDAKSFS